MSGRKSRDDPDSRKPTPSLLSRFPNRSRDDDLAKGKPSSVEDRRCASSESLRPGSSHSTTTDAGTRLAPVTESQPSSHLPQKAYGSVSKATPSSARTSNSSLLHTLDENVAVDPRSDYIAPPPPRATFAQRMVRRFTPPSGDRPSSSRPSSVASATGAFDYPVYPNQSYAVLQSQVHPTVHRSSNASTIARASSPGLFTVNNSAPPSGYADEPHVRGSYLHPTHLQPPKEYVKNIYIYIY